jgi:transposase
VEAILYVDRTGCGWRYLPADFGPYRAGTSRQGEPTRTRQRMPSISRRLVHFGGRPGFFGFGSNGSSTARRASLRSNRPVTAKGGQQVSG